jgi:hypothetical protein
MRVTNDIPLGYPLLLPVQSVNCVQTLKASPKESVRANFSLALIPPRFGLIVPDGAAVALTDLMTGASYGTFQSVVAYSASLPEFGIALLKLTVKLTVKP